MNRNNVSLEGRVSTLEQKVAELTVLVEKASQPKDWRSTIGMFAGDEVMKRIFEAGRGIREADRRRARQELGDQRMRKRKPNR